MWVHFMDSEVSISSMMFGLAWTSEAENGVLEMSVCAAHAAIATSPMAAPAEPIVPPSAPAPVLPAADLPEETPRKVMLGATALVVVRRGDLVFALKESCSHAGGPLSEGQLVGDTIVCPLHASAFRLADGAVRHGPASTRQVVYRARLNAEQVEVQGPLS